MITSVRPGRDRSPVLGAQSGERPGSRDPSAHWAAAAKRMKRFDSCRRRRRSGEVRVTGRRKSPEMPPRGSKASRRLGHDPAPPSLPRIPLKILVEVETRLVYCEGPAIAAKSRRPPASPGWQGVCQAPALGHGPGALPPLDRWLVVALSDAEAHYRQRQYSAAARRLTAALELCTRGAALGSPFDAGYEDICKVVSFIESKLVACYLRMKRPDLALNHSHRNIWLNPTDFHNHLQQAAVFRFLGRFSEAGRSAMIADYMYWLSGGSEQHISKLIKLYWQAMLEEAVTAAEGFTAMYTPCSVTPADTDIREVTDVFSRQHSGYTSYLFTDPTLAHLLPQTTNWALPSSQRYLITLGFQKCENGSFLDKLLTRKYPTFTENTLLSCPRASEDVERNIHTLGKRVLPVLDFIRCTKLADGFSAGSGVIQKLQYASYLRQLQRVTEHSQVIHQALAELAVAPYLQDISQEDTELLHTLMADTMATLEGSQTDKECVWNEMQKVGLLEDLIHHLGADFPRRRKPSAAARKQRARRRRGRAEQPQPAAERGPPGAGH
ncbi:spermatogenesis-associated protein 16 isoform X2 [Lepisosteus oculatus]|uniref:spermatogenesis-associated protein 16 isoform X2 n=1 Tax=Lepisosteus oculatus TaxID=7918 RepID=UPI0035F516D2